MSQNAWQETQEQYEERRKREIARDEARAAVNEIASGGISSVRVDLQRLAEALITLGIVR